ncbi:MAG: DNA repair protein RadA [Planctomycetota bacterium]
MANPMPNNSAIFRGMAKVKTQFVCRQCGSVHPRWMGKCPDCGEWDALDEVRPADKSAGLDPHRGGIAAVSGSGKGARPIGEVAGDEADAAGRVGTGVGEFDRVLGGAEGDGGTRGFVPGSAIMLGGDPGIGKSTLMLQAAIALARRGETVLYVTSEESAGQLRLRAERLARGGGQTPTDSIRGLPKELFVLADTNLARITEQARKINPVLLVIDSIQMVYKGDLPAAPGSVTQLRACCLELVYQAKATGTALMLVGHVTKQGALAGPRLLEHMVDTVLYFEGDRYHSHRVVRGVKNRFGSTLEVGLFEMTDGGLREVVDGAGLLAAEYTARSGSVVCPVLSGTRCLLVEVQALTAAGFLGSAKRKVSGLDRSRLDMLIAVLEKRGGLRLADQDVFASSVGGLRVGEPAADLAVALAIAGAHLERGLAAGTCVVGELGLGGEVRGVQQGERRMVEAARLGFTRIVCPAGRWPTVKGAELIGVKTLDAGLQQLG